MTWFQWAIQQLVANGMFEDQAQAVMAEVMDQPANDAMYVRWHDQMEGYPPQMKPVCWMSISSGALEWIDKNCPQAWFRGMFAPQSDTPPDPAQESVQPAPVVGDTAALPQAAG